MRGFSILFTLLFCQFCAYAQNWQTLDGTPNKYLNGFYDDTVTGKLFVAGTYSLIGGNDYRGIATWNGTQWDSLGAGIDDNFSSFPGNTHSVIRFGNDILIGGVFSKVGNITSKFLARWDGTQWNSMFGGQPNATVADLEIYNGELYVCGSFDSIGSESVHCIAKWNGTAWESIGSNYDFNGTLSGRLSRMVWYHNNLYVCGMFRDPWGSLCRLAKWNGTSWQFMVTDVQGSIANIEDMVVYNDELIVGGLFYQSSGNRANSVMKWNDTLWTDVGGSIALSNNIYPTVKDLAVRNNVLYCAGNFEIIGGITAMGLASWDGTNWCGYNTAFDLTPGQYIGLGCIGFYNDTMYVGGGFHFANGDSIPFLAKWIGGSFVDTCGNATGFIDYVLKQTEVIVYPNPSSSTAIFQFSSYDSREIIITDQLGRDIWREETNDNSIAISVSDFADGIYFYSIQDAEGSKSNGKFVVAH